MVKQPTLRKLLSQYGSKHEFTTTELRQSLLQHSVPSCEEVLFQLLELKMHGLVEVSVTPHHWKRETMTIGVIAQVLRWRWVGGEGC